MWSFVKIKPFPNGKIPLSFTHVGKSCPSCEFLTWQICLLMLFEKIKFSPKFPNLQYWCISWLDSLVLTHLQWMIFLTLIDWMSPFTILGLLDGYFQFIYNFDRTFCKQEWRHWSDAAICGIWLGTALFALVPKDARHITVKAYFLKKKNNFIGTDKGTRPPDNGVYLKNNFLISQPKHMLWILKRTGSIEHTHV